MRAAGLLLYEKALGSDPRLLRPGFADTFVGRGLHHDLADRGKVGWHLRFKERLGQLLATASPA